MNIIVHLHTILQIDTPEGILRQVQLTLSKGSTVADLLDQIELDIQPETVLLVVNGRMAKVNQLLEEGDEVNLMPAISGGSIGVIIGYVSENEYN